MKETQKSIGKRLDSPNAEAGNLSQYHVILVNSKQALFISIIGRALSAAEYAQVGERGADQSDPVISPSTSSTTYSYMSKQTFSNKDPVDDIQYHTAYRNDKLFI